MRTRDEKKQAALLSATISVVNEIGFASSSVSKIAKRAGVSPATLYVYFRNKEDLLLSAYLDIKQRMAAAMARGIDEDLPIHDSFRLIWRNTFVYASKHLEDFTYAEQFANSPYSQQVDRLRIQQNFEPLLRIINKGIDEKIIKDVDLDILAAFLFHPILVLANPNHCISFEPTEENIETAFRMAWDSLRL